MLLSSVSTLRAHLLLTKTVQCVGSKVGGPNREQLKELAKTKHLKKQKKMHSKDHHCWVFRHQLQKFIWMYERERPAKYTYSIHSFSTSIVDIFSHPLWWIINSCFQKPLVPSLTTAIFRMLYTSSLMTDWLYQHYHHHHHHHWLSSASASELNY